MSYETLLNKHYNLCNVTHWYFAPLHNGSAQVFGTWSVNVRFIQERLITNKIWDLEPNDSLAQLVEHSTFNAVVKGPSPLRITFGELVAPLFYAHNQKVTSTNYTNTNNPPHKINILLMYNSNVFIFITL